MKLNRKIQPAYKSIDKINIIKAECHKLNNNIPLYVINAGTEDVIRIDLIFDAGVWSNPKPLVATTTNALIGEGTHTLNSAEIHEKLDYYGAFINHLVNKDSASVSLYSLTKYLKETLPVFEDIVKNPSFPQKELDIYLKNKTQSFIVENEKVSTLSLRKFLNVNFGTKHPYGSALELKDFKNVDRKQLLDHHTRLYNANSCKIIVSGKLTNDTMTLLQRSFGNADWVNKNFKDSKKIYEIDEDKKKRHIIEKNDAIQSAIRIGKKTINKTHPDYAGLQVLNTVLGGYFGSRLMSNIREDKGYTYGIGSVVMSLKNSGIFSIITEAGADVTKETINEIYFELDKLNNELIKSEELNLVKNYMLGEILKIFDGPFSLADSFIGILEYGLDYDYFDNYIDTIKKITPEQLNILANKYFKKEEMYEVIAGKY